MVWVAAAGAATVAMADDENGQTSAAGTSSISSTSMLVCAVVAVATAWPWIVEALDAIPGALTAGASLIVDELESRYIKKHADKAIEELRRSYSEPRSHKKQSTVLQEDLEHEGADGFVILGKKRRGRCKGKRQ